MKKIKFLAIASFALLAGLTSCKKENTPEGNNSVVNSVEVRIKTGAVSAESKAGSASIPGVGDENVVSTGWYAFAKNSGANAFYTCKQATGGVAAFVNFSSVPVSSRVYVIANPDATTAATLAALKDQANITIDQINALVEAVNKAALQANTAALQADPAAPAVTPMLMTGQATVANAPFDPAAGQETKVKLIIKLEREYAKVNFKTNKTAGSNLTAAGNSATLISVDDISVHRVVNRIPLTKLAYAGSDPLQQQARAEWYLKKTPAYVGDVSVNTGTPAAGASDIVYHFAPVSAATTYDQNFYVTPNYSGFDAYATAVIVKAKINGVFDGVTYSAANNNEYRYFRAYVYDKDIVQDKGITLKNAIYNITATINGIGQDTETEALENSNVDLNIYVYVADWAVYNIVTDME